MPEPTPEYFDSTQYTRSEIEKYEAIYGRNFISPGGQRTSAEFIARLGLGSGTRVLDVGCGIGGCAFQMAAGYGARVDGIDVSRNMIGIARERCAQEGLDRQVRLIQGDILEAELGAGYDVVHSRDAFLHIHDKDRLFSRIRRLLKPGGLLAFTDYCRGDRAPDGDFSEYVEQRNYCLHTLAEYERLLQRAGLVAVRVEDRTRQFVDIHRREIEALPRDALGASDLGDLIEGWNAKIRRARNGMLRWGWFEARRAPT